MIFYQRALFFLQIGIAVNALHKLQTEFRCAVVPRPPGRAGDPKAQVTRLTQEPVYYLSLLGATGHHHVYAERGVRYDTRASPRAIRKPMHCNARVDITDHTAM